MTYIQIGNQDILMNFTQTIRILPNKHFRHWVIAIRRSILAVCRHQEWEWGYDISRHTKTARKPLGINKTYIGHPTTQFTDPPSLVLRCGVVPLIRS
jgi:hypothetical protein